MTATLIPIDFNSLCTIDGENLKLSDYYVDYALHSEGIEPSDGMTVTFYDKYWTPDPTEILCFDATIKEVAHELGSWVAELKGRVYASHDAPKRKYFSAFIGANTFLLLDGKKSDDQRLGTDPAQNKLAGVNVFTFAPGSELPKFSRMIGMNAKEVYDLFQFNDANIKRPVTGADDEVADDTLVVRGGGNRNENERSV